MEKIVNHIKNLHYMKILIAVNYGLGLGYIVLVMILIIGDRTWAADYTAFYTGWSIIRDGKGSMLYDLQLQSTIQKALLAEYLNIDSLLAFNYPPHVALILYPLSYLPFRISYIIWFLLQTMLVGFIVHLLWRQSTLMGWSQQESLALISVLVAIPAFYRTLYLGSFTILLLLCILGLYNALKKEKYLEAALWLVLGSFKPQVMVFPALSLVFSRRWKTLGYAVIIMLFIFVTSSVLLGWNIWLDFTNIVIKTSDSTQVWAKPSSMINLKGTLTILLSSVKITTINSWSIGFFILSAIVIAYLWLKYSVEPRQVDLLISLTILFGTFFGLHVNPQDNLFTITSGYWLYNTIRTVTDKKQCFGAFCLLCPILLFVYRFLLKDILVIKGPSIVMMILICTIAYLLFTHRKRFQ